MTPASDLNVAHLLDRAARLDPSAPLFVAPEGDQPYGEALARAAGFAEALRGRGVRAGDRVAILLERGPDAAAAWFGTVSLGAIAVLVNEGYRTAQLEHLLSHSAPRVLLSRERLLRALPRAPRLAVATLDAAEVAPGGEWRPVRAWTHQGAQIVYTSGSTGMPKGVLHSHGNLLACAATVSGYLGLSAGDRTAAALPFSSVFGFNQLLCAVATGGSLVVVSTVMASVTAHALRRSAVTVLAAVPPLWHHLLAAPEFRDEPLPALRVMQSAGGHLPLPLAAALRRAQPGARLFVMYGLTEALRSTWLPPEEAGRRPGSIGRAIPGARVEVVRGDGSACAPGELGEIVQQGPTVALGYWRDPAATAAAFAPASGGGRRLRTGDLGRADADGYLTFVGRRDRMIRSLGYRVGPDEVVEALLASGLVVEAAVLGEPDAARGERIVAHVVLAGTGGRAALADFCRRELPRYMQPARVQLHRALPRTANQKIDLRALERRATIR